MRVRGIATNSVLSALRSVLSSSAIASHSSVLGNVSALGRSVLK